MRISIRRTVRLRALGILMNHPRNTCSSYLLGNPSTRRALYRAGLATEKQEGAFMVTTITEKGRQAFAVGYYEDK